eukprot:jgi/Botrbrau1/7760/Bobra.0159s0189.1
MAEVGTSIGTSALYDVGKVVIKKLVDELGHIVYCRIEAQKLMGLLGRWVGTGDISRRILLLPPSLQTQFEAKFWGFLDAVEDARDVTKSALLLRRRDVPGRFRHSRQLRSIRERLQEFVDPGFLHRLANAAPTAQATVCGTGNRQATGSSNSTSNRQQDTGDLKNIFQQTETFIPHLKAQLKAQTEAGGKRNLALIGMPGSGKTTVARRVYEELKADYDKHLFMTVSQTPNLWQLLQKAGAELFGMREFDFDVPAELRDHLTKKMSEEGGKKVLLVLDDVWDKKHLEVLNFATGIQRDGEGNLLRHGSSRLLVTSRDRGVLDDLQKIRKSVSIEEPPLLEAPHDRHLLCHWAFPNSEPPEDLRELVEEVVAECKGNPLMLSVVGGGLRGKTLPNDWEQRLLQLKKSDSSDVTRKVMEICRPSYEELNLVARIGFKLFAAFPEDYQLQERELLLAWAGMVPLLGQPLEPGSWARCLLADLVDRSLVMLKPEGYSRYQMHDVLRDLAVSECSPKPPEHGRPQAVRHKFIQPDQPLEEGFPELEFKGGCRPAPLSVWPCSEASEHVTKLRHISVLGAKGGWPAHLRTPNLRYLDLLHSPWLGLPPGPLPHLHFLRLRDVYDVQKKVFGLISLSHLSLRHCPLPSLLGKGISALTGLQTLDLSGCGSLTSLPEGISALTGLQTLDLSGCGSLTSLPEGISALTSLQTLDLRGCGSLTSLPEGISALTSLQTLDLSGCGSLTSLPEGISALTSLQTLDLRKCGSLTSLREGISALTGLQTLDLVMCESLTSLPEGISALTGLQMLDLCGCRSLTSLPEGISALTGLQTLDLSGCGSLTSLPEGISALTGLRTLDLFQCGSLTSLPEGISALTGLQTPDLSLCKSLTSLPEGISALTDLQTLNLRECGSLTSLPEGISGLTGLQTLDLSLCESLTSLPEGISALTGLQTLDLSLCGSLTSLPEGISALTGLQTLALRHWQSLTSLPEGISALTDLQTLNLRECGSLTSLPEGISALTGLQTLDLRHCQSLTSLPEGISALTDLQTLDLRHCQSLTSLLEGISALTRLQTLNLFGCESLTSLPEGISALTGLQTLDLNCCGSLTSLPEGITALTGLQMLDLRDCESLTSLPEGISALTGLQKAPTSGIKQAVPSLPARLRNRRYAVRRTAACEAPGHMSKTRQAAIFEVRRDSLVCRLPNPLQKGAAAACAAAAPSRAREVPPHSPPAGADAALGAAPGLAGREEVPRDPSAGQ